MPEPASQLLRHPALCKIGLDYAVDFLRSLLRRRRLTDHLQQVVGQHIVGQPVGSQNQPGIGPKLGLVAAKVGQLRTGANCSGHANVKEPSNSPGELLKISTRKPLRSA